MSKEELEAKVKELEEKLQKVFSKGHEAICYVGQANYAERERAAHRALDKAMGFEGSAGDCI